MLRVIMVLIPDAQRFTVSKRLPEWDIAALARPSVPGRSRDTYATDEEFLEAGAHGSADRYTFDTLDEVAVFAKRKLSNLV